MRERVDKNEQSNMQEAEYLKSHQSQLVDGWEKFKLLQHELDEIDEFRRRWWAHTCQDHSPHLELPVTLHRPRPG